MEKILRSEPIFGEVEIGRKNITVWVASDGAEFTGEKAKTKCERWEAELERRRVFAKIPTVRVDIGFEGIPDYWYFPKDAVDLEIVKRELGYYQKAGTYVNGKKIKDLIEEERISPGQWMGGCIGYYPEDRDIVEIYTLDFILSQIELLRDSLKI